MAQVAGTTDSFDLVGIAEDVEDIIADLELGFAAAAAVRESAGDGAAVAVETVTAA